MDSVPLPLLAALTPTTLITGTAPPRCRRARRRPDAPTIADRLVAERTIPRGRDAADADPTPGVDPTVWLDHVRYARTRDPRILDRLATEYDRYALSLARRLHRDREPREDLDQVAREALVVAIQRFDPSRGLPFPSYGTPTILGALRRHYRDHGWLVRVPRRAHELTLAGRSTAERLTVELGHPPGTAEVAEALGVAIEDLLEAEEAVYAREALSLDAPGADDGQPLSERLGRVDPGLGLTEDCHAAMRAIQTLDEHGRKLLRLYYFEDCTQSEIGERLGVSQMQVSRLIGCVLRQLRQQVGPR